MPYNPERGEYERARVPIREPNQPQDPTPQSQPGHRIGTMPGGQPNISDIPAPTAIQYDPSANLNQQYIDELSVLGQGIPGLGGGGYKPQDLTAESVEDVGYSQQYEDFSGALNQI